MSDLSDLLVRCETQPRVMALIVYRKELNSMASRCAKVCG